MVKFEAVNIHEANSDDYAEALEKISQLQAENKRLREAVEMAEKEHPLELDYENDARYVWPERWNIIKQALKG